MSDPVGFVAAVAACAVSLGLMVVAATVLGVDMLRSRSLNLGLPFYILFLGTLGGILVAGISAWRLLGPIGSTYRRGGLALVSAFATVLLMLVCIPVNELLGRKGLALLIGLSAAAALLLLRRIRRIGYQT